MHAASVTATPSRQASDHARARHRHRPESVLAPLWVFVVVLAVLIAAGALPTASRRAPHVGSAVRRVRVAASDTLWSIAASNPVEGLSTARSVAIMRELNGLTGSAALQPGGVISVPCASEGGSDLALR
jgi:hypothetical protein